MVLNPSPEEETMTTGEGKTAARAEFDESTMILVDIAIGEPTPQCWPILEQEKEQTIVMYDPTEGRVRAYTGHEPSARVAPHSRTPAFARASLATVDPAPLYFGHVSAHRPTKPELDPSRWFAFVCGFVATVIAWAIFIQAPPHKSLEALRGPTAHAHAAETSAPAAKAPRGQARLAVNTLR
jgi:hypothetical protein